MPVAQHPAAGGGQQARDDVEQGGLAAAGGAHHRDELVLVNIQADAVQSDHLAVAAVKLLDNVLDLDLHRAGIGLQISRFSCHPVSFLSTNLMSFSMMRPMMPITMMYSSMG